MDLADYTQRLMTEHDSLLAYLSPRFTGRTEDIAVEALGFILSTSKAAREALVDLLRSNGGKVNGLGRIATQDTGDQGERPDLVGCDETGDKCLLIEAKFWAGLTDNQPNGYLNRLRRGGTLLFVAPEARLDTLWPELEQRVRQEFKWTADAGDTRTADASGRRLILTSWRALLDAVERQADADGDTATVASVRQLQGLCADQDESAFLPLRPDELGPDVPRRLLNLRNVINRVVDRATAEDIVGIDGLGKKVALDGYGRWLELRVWKDGSQVKSKPAGACLCVHYTAWSQHGETPIWLELADREDDWPVLPLKKVRKRLGEQIVEGKDGTVFVPIRLPTGVELDQVVGKVVAQLRDLAHRIARVASD